MNKDTSEPPLLPTRRSLLSRLRSWDNHEGWQEFFDRYWRLIYDVARKAGLNDAGAQDVVQDTIVSVARLMPDFHYDAQKGSFKGWLMQITRRRTIDHLRRHYRQAGPSAAISEPLEISENSEESPAPDDWASLWDAEWRHHVSSTALQRLKSRFHPRQLQIFELNVLHGWPASKVSTKLKVSLMQVYLAKHRIGSALKREIRQLETGDCPGAR